MQPSPCTFLGPPQTSVSQDFPPLPTSPQAFLGLPSLCIPGFPPVVATLLLLPRASGLLLRDDDVDDDDVDDDDDYPSVAILAHEMSVRFWPQ